MPRFKCLPYRPPSPEEQPKAGPGEDEKTRRTREPDFPTRATRVYASVEEAERARGHLPEVYGTSEWADQFHFPRRTQPVGRGRFTLPTAHDSAPRPGGSSGAHALGENEKRQSITARASKPKKQSAPRVVKLDLTRVDDDTPVTIDGSSSSSSEDVDDRVAPTDSEENASWAEAFSDEPRWGKDDDATWHPAMEGRKRRDTRRKSRASEPVKRTRRTKRRVEPPTLTSSPVKHARNVDRFLFRRGAARAMGSVMAREAPRREKDDERSSSGGGGDDDDDTDGGDDDDDASLPPSVSGDDSSSSSSFSSSSSAPAPGPSVSFVRRKYLDKAG